MNDEAFAMLAACSRDARVTKLFRNMSPTVAILPHRKFESGAANTS
jgi:hypothetical protein